VRRRSLLQLLPGAFTLLVVGLHSTGLAVPPPAPPPMPLSRSDRLRFLALADTGSGDANQRAVGQQMAALHRRAPVDLVLLGGDNIYPSGDLALIEATFRRPYAELLAAGVPFHAVLGNHDIRTANGAHQIAYAPFGMKGRYYNLQRGPVEFFMLDTNVNADWAAQLSWLRGVLARSTAPWKVVVGHHPIYSSGLYGNNPALRARLTPIMHQYGVQLYINGHEHNYERSVLIDGITYLVVGGGGVGLRPVLPTAQSAKALSVHSFVEIQAGADALQLTAWDRNGRKIDQATILPRPAGSR
jgi:3',5'-cyclic AMP phosphodiesterase CpdA